MANWHRRGTGFYVRKRINSRHKPVYDRVERVGNRWRWTIENMAKSVIASSGKTFPTRIQATSALDSYIENQKVNSESERETEHNHTDENSKCDGCDGSGIYYGRGYIENGVFKGHTGECFRCRGKGHQTEEDRKRNQYYDNHVRRIEV